MNWRQQAFLLGHDLIGSELRSHYREFCEVSQWAPGKLCDIKETRLKALLQHAIESIPYYRSRVSVAELSGFPVLHKDDVHQHFQDLMEPSLLSEYKGTRSRAYSWVEVKTGGSTGMPTIVIHDRQFRDWGRASRLYSQALCGFPIGTPFFKLWGSMRDISEARDSPTKRILDALLQVHVMNAFLMDEQRMASYVAQMNNSSIHHLMGYVDAADELARFIRRKELSVRPLASIMACAGTVTAKHRERLGSVFGARVHNKYGSRECADLACECSEGGFHIFSNGILLEIVDDDDKPVPDGCTGRILVTLLHNLRFPLIRYEIGDMGSLSAAACPCGSPLPLMRGVEGRISEAIISLDGSYVSPLYIIHLVGVVHNPGSVSRFQFVQSSKSTFELAVQMDKESPGESFARMSDLIHRDLKVVLGENAELTIKRVEHIAPSASGKFRYVRNLCRET